MKILEAESVGKRYFKKPVLSDVNLTIEQGKIVGLLGMFIASLAVIIVVGLQVEKLPFVKFDLFGTQQSLAQMILNILGLVLPFLGASYLMEKRIEN